MSSDDQTPRLECGAPHRPETIVLAHGGGGRRMRQLLHDIVVPALDRGQLQSTLDSALFEVNSLFEADQRLAVTTDSYVVTPREFPGGDIGSLAVYGTVNDLAVSGARPLLISVALIAEEGLAIDEFTRIVQSIGSAADAARVHIVTGDTKVVDRGHGHGLYINTTGIGTVRRDLRLEHASIRQGDAIIVSGDVGRHGVAILSVREGLQFEGDIESDAAPLSEPIAALLDAGVDVRFMRDLTRGGLATALCEIALDGNLSLEIEETHVAVDEAVSGACELLGLDPLYVANEGRFVAIVAAHDVDRAMSALRAFPQCNRCALIGRVTSTATAAAGHVVAVTALGARRVLDLMSGEQLPRIC